MLSVFAPIAGSLLGGILDRKSAKRAAAQERAVALEDDAQKFVRLREAAEAGGFNPLTALQYNFGASMPSGVAAPLSVSSMVSQGFQAAADWATGKTAADNQRRILEDRLLQLEVERAEATANVPDLAAQPSYSGRAAVAPAVAVSSGFNSSVSSGSVRPRARPTPETAGRVPMYNQFGNPVSVLASTAERLGLRAFDTLTAGEATDLLGEITEVETAVGQHNVRPTQVGTTFLTGSPTTSQWSGFGRVDPAPVMGALGLGDNVTPAPQPFNDPVDLGTFGHDLESGASFWHPPN